MKFVGKGRERLSKLKKITAVLLLAALLLSLCACGSSGGYQTLVSFGTEQYSIGFRNDDLLRYYIEAAVKTVAAEGTIDRLAVQWFGESRVTFPSDAGALEALGLLPSRSITVGVDPDAFPVSYLDTDGSYKGFDIDVVRTVCSRLGWGVDFISIKAEDAYVELSSGNVDIAWGGLALDQTSKKYTTIYPYLENEIVIISRGDSKISSKRKLSGATLAMDTAQKYMDALSTDAELMGKLGQIRRVSGGAPALFSMLASGQADAVLVTELAAKHYYGR